MEQQHTMVALAETTVQELATCLRGALLHPGDVGYEQVRQVYNGMMAQPSPSYMLTLVDRGADTLAAAGQIRSETATALKAEAQSRVEVGTFFGYIGYASLIARRPAA